MNAALAVALAIALFAIILILIFATGHGVLGRPSDTATAAGSAAALGRPPSVRELGSEGGMPRAFRPCAAPARVIVRHAAAFEVQIIVMRFDGLDGLGCSAARRLGG